ncbi:Ldh family oxidoreductase [Bosea lathyri]|uniref:Malate/lactate/ureidoglycolate dehydrogenase, LDH2 family n=1 Tax=Bosea lathyri TaxID=1036778 RepID=A0A1H6CBQ2_9HYPH|nr:Ldh family oxidoreductase [Bosea lathyri]SEG69826.1 Malate/lactate/ureidoglycolate dehydrogenase, LDH2 family [Bosea lathyri]
MDLSAEEVRRVCTTALLRAGVPDAYARLQVDLLLEAELRGRPSHGVLRLARIVERIRNQVTNPSTTGEHIWEGQALLAVDGQAGLGPVVACAALDAIEERARSTGIAIAAISNNNHLGMMAWYAERTASRGSTLLALSTSEALVHAWGGRRAMVGTNPIAIGVPAVPRPFVIDMATSLVSMGQIHDHARRDEAIPPSWALDRDGNPTSDPHAARDGAIAPFGEAKGYALGLAFEILVASLTASAIGRDVRGTLDATEICNKGDVFIVIHASASGAMARGIGAYLDAIRADIPADGFRSVAIPGDRSRSVREARLRDGVPVTDAVWTEIVALAEA